MTLGSAVALSSGLLLLAARAHAQADTAEPATEARTVQSAQAGSFLSLTRAATGDRQRAYVATIGGYDSARRSATFETNAAARIWGPLTLRAGALWTTRDGKFKPTLGAFVQTLRETQHGLDLSLGLTYRPEGLTQAEGEIEASVAAGLHIANTYLLGNLVYGQDPEARERDVELRLASLTRVSTTVLAGLDARARVDAGSQATRRRDTREATFDALLGPVLVVAAGPLACQLHAGLSALRANERGRYGAFANAGLAAPF